VSLMEQVLYTLPEHTSSPPVFSGVRVTRSLVLWECFADHCCPFVLFLLAIVLSVLRRYTDSDDTVISSNSSYIKLSNNKSISIKAFVAYNFRRARVFFYVICVCLRNVVSNTYGFVVFFTLCTLCCQLAWIVHFWLPLRYSLTFI
jgi:hypothetical protein